MYTICTTTASLAICFIIIAPYSTQIATASAANHGAFFVFCKDMLATCIWQQACETSLSHRETARRLSWPGIPCANPLRAARLPGHKSWCRRSPSRKARRGRMVKRSVLLPLSCSPHARVPPTGHSQPYLCHIAHRQPISVCDQHIAPARPARSLSASLLWASSTTTLTRLRL